VLLNILGDKVKCAGYYVIQGVSAMYDLSTAGIVAAESHMKPSYIAKGRVLSFPAVNFT
jgi:hypothetical protein